MASSYVIDSAAVPPHKHDLGSSTGPPTVIPRSAATLFVSVRICFCGAGNLLSAGIPKTADPLDRKITEHGPLTFPSGRRDDSVRSSVTIPNLPLASPLQSLARLKHPLNRLLRSVANRGEMAHFAARTWHALFIEVQAHTGYSQRAIKRRWMWTKPHVTKQIRNGRRLDHTRISQWKIANRAHCLFKLAGNTGALTGVITVVGTRSKLVYQELLIFQHEHLNHEQSNYLKLLRNL